MQSGHMKTEMLSNKLNLGLVTVVRNIPTSDDIKPSDLSSDRGGPIAAVSRQRQRQGKAEILRRYKTELTRVDLI